MDNNPGSRINSALALTKTHTIQQYHVFAYIIANDIDKVEVENPTYGCIVILASFSDTVDDKGKPVSGKKLAINYAQDLVSASGYDMIFWTETHKWFNLKQRPLVKEIFYIDDKSGLEDASNYINVKTVEQSKEKVIKGLDKKIEEEQKLHRARCNPDHVEHFINHLFNLVDALTNIKEWEKKLDDAREARDLHLGKLKEHYNKHPKHEENSLLIIKDRLKPEEYVPFVVEYSKVKTKIAPEEVRENNNRRIYEKKSGESSNSSSRLSERHSVSDRSNKEDSEKDRSYSDVVSGNPNNEGECNDVNNEGWKPVERSVRRRRNVVKRR